MEYAFTYFAHYPALVLLHWPPLVHIAEGIMFTFFGPSVFTARLTILLFAVLGLWSWFQLVCELDNQWTAALSTVLLAITPQVLLFEKAVMLEVPAMALCLAATYLWVLYLKKGGSRHLYAFALLAGLALITKQLTAYLVPFCIITLIRARRRLVVVQIAQVLAVIALIAGPFYLLSLYTDWRSISGNVFMGANTVAHPYLYYLTLLPSQLGWPLLLLSLLGMLTCWWRHTSENTGLMLMWIGAVYATNLLISTKDPRYSIYWLPSFVYMAAEFLTSGAVPRRFRWVSIAAAMVVFSSYAISAWRYDRPYVEGYAAAAEQVSHFTSSSIILYDGELEANFMFFLRLHDPSRHFVLLRKALYVTAVMNRFGAQEVLHSPSELNGFIRSYGIKYVVLEEPSSVKFAIQKDLRDLMQTAQFKAIGRFPLATNIPGWNGKEIVVYQNTSAAAPTAKDLRVKMLSTGHDIIIPFPSVSEAQTR